MMRLSLSFLVGKGNELEAIEMAARLRISKVYFGLLCTLFCSFLGATETDSGWSYTRGAPEQHALKMQWWNTARFGMFVHWGVYSVTGGAYKGKMPTNS